MDTSDQASRSERRETATDSIPRDGDQPPKRSTNGVRPNPVLYRTYLGWDVRPAHYAKERSGHIECSCYRGANCAAAGKHPLGKWQSGDGLNPPSVRYLESEWRWHPWNVAVLTGKRSGVIVADVDPRHGGTLETLWALGWPQETPVEQTGGGGWHVYAACPPEGLASVDGYADGIELKADGKLVIAAPSVYWNGARYHWLEGQSPWDCPPAMLPDEVIAGMRSRTASQGVSSSLPPLTDAEIQARMPQAKRLVRRAVERAQRGIDGGRHNTGVWLACQLRDLRVPREVGARLMLAYQRKVEVQHV